MYRHAERGACLLQDYRTAGESPRRLRRPKKREKVLRTIVTQLNGRTNEGAFFGKRWCPTEPAHYFPLPKHIGSCHAPTTQGGGEENPYRRLGPPSPWEHKRPARASLTGVLHTRREAFIESSPRPFVGLSF